jgi:6-phosphogluconolactonase (cycloisomerase 2 family)
MGLFALSLAAITLSCNMQSTHLAYVTAGADGIFAFRIRDGNGVITQVFTSPFLPQDAAFGIVVHPSNRFAFVANQRAGSISLLSIDPTSGALTEKLRTPAGTSPGPMILNSDGSFLFIADQALNQILVFSVAGNGSLSQVSSAQVGSTPTALTLASSGVLFVPVPNLSAVYVFTVSSGALTPVCFGGGPVCSPLILHLGVAPSLGVDPAGKFLYVPNPAASTVSGFVIQSGGVLTPVPGVDFSTGTTSTTSVTATSTVPVAAAVDPTGKFLYVANSNTATASAFDIDPNTGDLTAFTTIPPGVGSNPEFIMFDPDNMFMYVADSGSKTITQLFLTGNGSLFSTGNTMTIGSIPRGLAFTK